jgi:hypothetical protein
MPLGKVIKQKSAEASPVAIGVPVITGDVRSIVGDAAATGQRRGGEGPLDSDDDEFMEVGMRVVA